jgi:large subunit ribosomal protein L35Ae
LTQTIHGRITNYRTGPKSQSSKECLVEFETINSNGLADQLIGQKVAWKNGNNTIFGKVRGAHGKNGMVRVRFSRGVPGQAIGKLVELKS